MYDDYPSPPGTPSSSRLRAIPHLHSPLAPHPYGQPATKASDIAHLLDPSYSPTRTAYLNQVYVDHAGEAHDPDFRLFAPASYSPKRRDFLTCESDDEDDDDVPELDVPPLYPKRASFDSYRPDSRASDPLFYTHPDSPQHSAYADFTYTFADPAYHSDDEPRREANKLRRRRASLEHEHEEHPHLERPDHLEKQPRAEATPTPTTTAFRRQWHALRLRTQVAAFRARKRVTRIVCPTAG